MTSPISITVPREPKLLALAAAFLTGAAAHVAENPHYSLTHSIGELSSTVEGLDALAIAEAVAVPERVQELQKEIATSLEQDVETAEAAVAPINVKAAFTPKPSLFDAPPVYEMTELAGTYTREDYHNAEWTDEQLLESGFMVAKVAAVASVAAAPIATPAPPAPTPSLPNAPAPTPAPHTSGATASGEIRTDSAGTPWDARIHAGTKTFMKSDGTWKLKKGVDKAEVERVTAELRQLSGNPPLTVAPKAPVPSSAPAPKAPAPSSAGGEPAGALLMRKLTAAMTAKELTYAQVLEAVRDPLVGLKETKDLCLPGNEAKAELVDQLLFGG